MTMFLWQWSQGIVLHTTPITRVDYFWLSFFCFCFKLSSFIFKSVFWGCKGVEGEERGWSKAGVEWSHMHTLQVVVGRPQRCCRKANPTPSTGQLHQQYLSRFTGGETVGDWLRSLLRSLDDQSQTRKCHPHSAVFMSNGQHLPVYNSCT